MLPEFHEGLHIDHMAGVLLGSLEQFVPNSPPRTWQLAAGTYCLPVVVASDDLLHELLSQPLAPFLFRMMDWIARTQDAFCVPSVIIDSTRLHERQALDFLPPDTCPVMGVLPDARALINQIQTEPLRRLIHRVFEERDVCARYWTMPASARHHHAHPGGLAEHSLEVAEDMATQGQLTGVERDLGIAGALLHDIGKVWAYTGDMFCNTAGLAMGHELIGLARVERHLQVLEAQWPDGAYAMRVLLSGSGRVRSDGSLPSALVARIRACDQRSCERNRGHSSRTARSWIPQPYAPSVVAE